MNQTANITPSQRAWHEAAKAREAGRQRAARRLKIIKTVALPPPVAKPKPQLVNVIHRERIVPLHFSTFKLIRMTWGGEYSADAGGSTLIAVKRSMVEIALHWLKLFPGVTVADIKSDSRKHRVVLPRQMIVHAIKVERPDLSFPHVGRWMGGRDHTTALHAFNKIQAMIDRGTLDEAIEEWQRAYGKVRAR